MDDDSVARSRWYMWSRGQLVQVVIVRGTALVLAWVMQKKNATLRIFSWVHFSKKC